MVPRENPRKIERQISTYRNVGDLFGITFIMETKCSGKNVIVLDVKV